MTCCSWAKSTAPVISTHILTKRMTVIVVIWQLKFNFNSHPHEEDDRGYETEHPFIMYFNSHPHEEDDGMLFSTVLATVCISTHILTKRMTFVPYTIGIRTIISTHILTKRMTVQFTNFTQALTFQLTSSRRGWPYSPSNFFVAVIFQLTSSRRGWPQPLTFTYPSKYFNSHPHEEDD